MSMIVFYPLAALRALLIFSGMLGYMLFYGLSCIFVPHSPQRALRLRAHYLVYYCCPILNINIQISGAPHAKTALYVANHRSFADPIVLCRYIPAFVIAKAEVKSYPIINIGAELTGVIWVNRQDTESRMQTRSKMIEVIQSGFNVLVFPEGTVSLTKNTLPFKKGTFLEAAGNNIPVVPVAIEYQSPKDLWMKEKFIPQYFHQFSKWKTTVKISFGAPLRNPDGLQLYAEAQHWINNELTSMQVGWSKVFTDLS
jgi:1-acyl-sn-glycerol-3-phosphate acyltransferase